MLKLNIKYFIFCPIIQNLCLIVKVIPEFNRIIVFSKGIPHLKIFWIPTGGHLHPISTLGDSLLWKKDQKRLKNNIISDNKNPKNPNFKLRFTILVYNKEASKNKILLNQKIIINNKKVKGKII